MRVAFIGGGEITRALLNKPSIFKSIIVSGNCSKKLDYFKAKGFETTTCNKEAVKKSDVLIFATKPKDLPKVFESINNIDLKDQLPISVVAGVGSDVFFDNLKITKLIRVMPNTPASIGKGMSVWWNKSGSEHDKKICSQFLHNIGKEIEVSEENIIDKATALSGSGPAYVFYFIESLIDAGVHIGLSRQLSQELVIQTIIGSTFLISQSKLHPSILKNNITSPSGTTTRGLYALEKNRFKYAILEAVKNAHN